MNNNKLEELKRLEEEIRSCRKCALWQHRKNAVPGEGSYEAEIMLIGEAPGATEDETGRPFVGAAGTLLRKILSELGLDEKKIYITNIVKCRPPGNRTPRREEIEACSPYLEKQIKLIRPRIIVTLGNVSSQWIFEKIGLSWDSMSREHGRIREATLYGEKIKILPTYHPSAAIRGSVDPEVIKRDLELIIKDSVEDRKEKRVSTLYDFIKKKDQ